jgi:hypothetical protein
MLWRNERIWYQRKCDATGKSILSIYDPKKGLKVYHNEYWKGDAWDPLEYSRPYDFSKNFFVQFAELFRDVPHPNLIQKNTINSDFSNNSLNTKNCYFTISTDGAEDCAYINGHIRKVKESMDLHQTTNSEFCYELVDCDKSNRLFYSQNSISCVDSYFLYDCKNCTNCYGCTGLRNKQYCVFNQQLTKEEYKEVMDNINVGSYTSLIENKEKFEMLKQVTPRKYAFILNSQNVSGDDIVNSRNCHYCFFARDEVENCKYSYRLNQKTKDVYDGYIVWNGAELLYEALSSTGQNIKLSGFIWGGFDVEYSYNCFDCNNIFGCIGLKNKSYCIFNQQYTKEEYEVLVEQIKQHMSENVYTDVVGREYKYGEFFPPELSPFAYNETPAQEYFPKDKESSESNGYTWHDTEARSYQMTKMFEDIEDEIKDVPDSITGDVIECLHRGQCGDQCSTAFKVIPFEFAFLKRFNLPLPRLCPGCRHMERVRLRNPMKLWHRQCMCDISNHDHPGVCSNEFETTYSSDRPEVIYCEQCYQKEMN